MFSTDTISLCLNPAETGTDLLYIEVLHGEVGFQQLHRFVVDRVLREGEKRRQEVSSRHQLKNLKKIVHVATAHVKYQNKSLLFFTLFTKLCIAFNGLFALNDNGK